MLVDVSGLRRRGAGDIDRGESTRLPQKAMERAVGIDEVADGLAAIIDPVGVRVRGAGDIDSSEALSV
jgi:hypothetical protein